MPAKFMFVRNTRNTLTMIWRSLLRDMRTVDSLLMAVMLPVMILVLFTVVFGGAIHTGMNFIDYVVPGIFLLCVGFGTAPTAVSVCTDATTGLMDRFRSLPITSGAVLTGHVVSGVIRNLIAMGIVILLAIALGFRPTADPLEWLGVFAILGLFILMLTWGAAAFGLLVKSPEAAGSFAFMTMIFPYFSGGFVPISTLPEWVQGFAYNQPWTHIVEAIRGLLLGIPVGNHAWLAVAWCGSITVIMYAAARVLFKIQATR